MIPCPDPLGAFCGRESTLFRLWAPTASGVVLALYGHGSGGEPRSLHPLRRSRGGAWAARIPGDLHGTYYAYRLLVDGSLREAVDPHAASAGANGRRGLILDQARSAPPGWDSFVPPRLSSPNDAVVYEVHIRDLSCHPSWTGPEELRGTYAGALFEGAPGLAHLRSLGVTHLQILPFSDFVSVDEERLGDPAYRALRRDGAFNWGYDPGNYDSPEGSYSSEPSDGQSRVLELKALVKAAGDAGMGVVMDVVYNHVPDASRSSLGLTAPGYFFRAASASGAGDDTASERPMMRRFMIASLGRWLRDYRLSGFRFDLMGLHDVGTMRAVESALRRIKGDVLLYGEGWDLYRGGGMRMASQPNIRLLERRCPPGRPRGIGMFNDAFRDGIKGSVFDAGDRGFIHGGNPGAGRVEGLKFGIVGATRHPGVDNALVAGTAMPRPWTGRSASSVNYAEIHDNLTLFDKNQLAAPGLGDDEYRALQRLGLALVLLAQGMPVLHAGGEFLRTKELPSAWLEEAARGGQALPGDLSWTGDGSRAFSHNSYNLSDKVNALDWDCALRERALVDWTRGLIALRLAHPVFRLRTGREVRRRLRFLPGADGRQGSAPGLLAWSLRGGGLGGETWKEALVVFNASAAPQGLSLPTGEWRLVADKDGVTDIGKGDRPPPLGRDGGLKMPGRELLVLARPDCDHARSEPPPR